MVSTTISGNSGNFGGGIFNDGELVLVGTVITGNTAGIGGGIYNCLPTDLLFGDTCQGTPITFRHTTVTNNVPNDIFPDSD